MGTFRDEFPSRRECSLDGKDQHLSSFVTGAFFLSFVVQIHSPRPTPARLTGRGKNSSFN
jgi:hypothetical protein